MFFKKKTLAKKKCKGFLVYIKNGCIFVVELYMGSHDNLGVVGAELKRKKCLGLKVCNFMTVTQLANLYKCTESNVKQNILKINRKTKRKRKPKVDYVQLYPSDLTGAKADDEKEKLYIVCNDKLYDLLSKRSFELNSDLIMAIKSSGLEFVQGE